MTNEELVKKINELLRTDADLDFLLVLKKNGSGEAGCLYQRKGRSGR